jgi:hypothetical protein
MIRAHCQTRWSGRVGLTAWFLLGINHAAALSIGDPAPQANARFVDPDAAAVSWMADGADVAAVPFELRFGPAGGPLAARAALAPGAKLAWTIADLEFGQNYQWQAVALPSGLPPVEGPIWNFTTKPFPIPGTVVDHSPKSTNRYVGSPSIAILPNGDYVASHDWFGSGTNYNTTEIFRSSDRGLSWRRIATVEGQFWSTLFWHQGSLYLMGTSSRYGYCAIRRSSDGGRTWTTPSDGETGRLFPEANYHTAPMPVVVHNGRIWRAMEDANGGSSWGNWFRLFMMSAPLDADLLKASSWTSSNRLARNASWLDGQFGGWLESNALIDPEGNMVIVPRVDYREVPEKAAIVRVSSDGASASFDSANDFITFPGGAKKFTIRRDEASGLYWTLANAVLPQHIGGNVERTRNAVALMSSSDLREWTTHAIPLYHPNVSHHGFQYLDWQFDGEDMIVASRTAHDDGLGGAAGAHDANFFTFHRIANFRGPHPPMAESHPSSQRVVVGESAVFRAKATQGSLEWRWYRRMPDGSQIELTSSGRYLIASAADSSELRIHGVSTSDAGDYLTVASNSSGSVEFMAAPLVVLARDLLHHWPMDDAAAWSANGSPLLDLGEIGSDSLIQSSTATRNLIKFGEPGAAPQTGSSIYFGGSNARAELGPISPRANPFTLSFWFKLNAFSGVNANQDHIVSSNSGQASRWNIHLMGDAAYLAEFGGPRLVFWQVGPGIHEIAPAISPGTWHHVVVIRGSEPEGNFRLYFDRALVHQSTNHLDLTNSERGVWLGARPTSPISSAFDGWIDDVRLYDRPLEHLGELWDDAYAAWARANFAGVYGAPGTRPTDSYAGDGMANLLKFSFGLDPSKPADRQPMPLTFDPQNGGRLRLDFVLRPLPSAGYSFEESAGFHSWNSYPLTFSGAAWSFPPIPGAVWQELWRTSELSRLRLTYDPVKATEPQGFFRLRVDLPN